VSDEVDDEELAGAAVDEDGSADAAGKTDNAAAQLFDVTYSFPDSVEIRMVDASSLSDYEIWFAIASLLSNFAVGFLIAYIQSNHDGSLLVTALIFVVMLIGAVVMAAAKRSKLGKKARRYKGPPGSLTPVDN
jgi:hypothetical protein